MLSDQVGHAVLVLAGVAGLYLGAEALVRGAVRLALGIGLRAAVVGVTVVAFATTTPELFVAVLAGAGYSPALGLGAVVGSNIANVGLVLGVAALVRPFAVDAEVLRRHVPFMLGATALLVVLAADGRITAVDGAVLVAALAAFTLSLLLRSHGRGLSARSAAPRDVLLVVVGLVFLLLGARALIEGGTGLLAGFGIAPRIVGLTVLALGTSLPELATSVVSARRDEGTVSVANVVGSNIYNVLAVLGVLALFVPVEVPASVVTVDLPVLVAFTLGGVALMVHRRDVSRLDGTLLLGGYVAFVAFLF
ncbi:calcium/sodium antiporter [Salinigranum halophilum]|jgi:cation:H+ antiporter|uniref:calcium/sodium antiporter n=1 Tax=Salinigranum halophilum TaxID=2565931 RepID=UPI00115F6683|nr:calcium/sodium antiporter [Salinigranum halophilum]